MILQKVLKVIRNYWTRLIQIQRNKKLQNAYHQLSLAGKKNLTMMQTNPLSQVDSWRDGTWKVYEQWVIDHIPLDLKGKIVADFGCKYGLAIPLLFDRGAKQVIGIEVSDSLLNDCKILFQEKYNQGSIQFVKSSQGFIPLQPDTVDLVIVNEVISHVNPFFLSNVYIEIARILKPGGMVFISDGNNLSCPLLRENILFPLYWALEHGPIGTHVGDVKIKNLFIDQRKDFIQKHAPEIEETQADDLARNTYGLFDEYLVNVIDQYMKTGEIIRRPFQKWNAPARPNGGMVEEKGFYPEQVKYDLMSYGFDTRILRKLSLPPIEGERLKLDTDAIEPLEVYGANSYVCPISQFSWWNDADFCIPLLLENGKPLEFPESSHQEIGSIGMGRYYINYGSQSGSIYFSTSDNSDPRTNGRKYELYRTPQHADEVTVGGSNFQVVGRKKLPISNT